MVTETELKRDPYEELRKFIVTEIAGRDGDFTPEQLAWWRGLTERIVEKVQKDFPVNGS